MPFPYVFHENFETGTRGGFTSETDDEGRVDFPDWRDNLDIDPWRGGHVMRVDLNRGSAGDACVVNNSVLNIGSGTNRYIRFYLWIGDDFRAPDAAGSSLRILDFNSLSGTEGGIGISCSESELWGPRLAVWSPDDPTAGSPSGSFMDGLAFKTNQWLPIQIIIKHGGADSRLMLQLYDNMIEVPRMNMATFTSFKFGAMAQSSKLRGTLYFDDIIIDTEKLEEPAYLTQDELWGNSQLYTKSSYAFLGSGTLRGATLIGGGSDNVAYLYDADRLPLAHHDIKAALRVSAAESKDTLIETFTFQRGCYIQMSGTNPQVIVHYGEKG